MREKNSSKWSLLNNYSEDDMGEEKVKRKKGQTEQP